MRIVPFIVSAAVTAGLIIAMNVRLTIGGNKTPRFGYFLSPQQGFWQNAEPTNKSYDGEIKLADLSGKADVYFDERLVPHVYADNEKDAYYIQGYLHAKFRLWQMDFQTRAAGGRLSEVVGKSQLGIDRMFRRLGMVYAAENSLKAHEANPVIKEEMDAYTAGVNAYLKSLKPHQIPLEYKLLDSQPEEWSNLKTALFLKFMSFDLAGAEWDFEMANARRLLGATDFEKLYPIVSDSLDPILPKGTAFAAPGVQLNIPANADSSMYRDTKDTTINGGFAFDKKPDPDNGSNNWAVAGSKSASGRPILANDPHLGLNLPSLWYEMQISTPAFNAYGATFPGAPSIVIGFNDHCSWGFTNAMRDVRDYYEIKFKDTTMQEYWFNNQWVRTEFRDEVIKIRDSADLKEHIAMTVFGPVMFDKTYPNKLEDGKNYAVRWKAHDPGVELLTFNKLNHAKNLDDYKDAIATFKCPGQNMIFATKTGDIAITQQGEFPAKWRRQGDFPMPGFDSTYMWQVNIPLNENPQMINPPRGYVSSANQLPVDTTYPYYLGGSYPPYRGFIINRYLNQMNSITPQDMMRLQGENYNVFAEFARPVLLKYIDENGLSADEHKYFNLLKNWNLRNDPSEAGASVFKAVWDSLEVAIFSDEMAALTQNGKYAKAAKWPDESTLVEALRKDSTGFRFIDDIRTPEVETLQFDMMKAFKMAVAALKKADDAGNLGWAKFKDGGVRHLLKIEPFSRLHLNEGGGDHIINATKQWHGPSWRMIVHMTDKSEAYGVYPGGQDGNPGSKYYDNFIDTWVVGKYYPLLFVPKTEAANNKSFKWHLTFSKA